MAFNGPVFFILFCHTKGCKCQSKTQQLNFSAAHVSVKPPATEPVRVSVNWENGDLRVPVWSHRGGGLFREEWSQRDRWTSPGSRGYVPGKVGLLCPREGRGICCIANWWSLVNCRVGRKLELTNQTGLLSEEPTTAIPSQFWRSQTSQGINSHQRARWLLVAAIRKFSHISGYKAITDHELLRSPPSV